ncbi:MAG: lipopolysaccharide biosynthesis protein, partial [Algisphaera sp.]
MTTATSPTAPLPTHRASRRAQALDTASLTGQLRHRSVRGVVATSGTQTFKFVNNLITGAILARLLTPADFGVIAMAAAFTGLAAVLRHGGLSIGIIQREHVSHAQVNRLFWLNGFIAASTACILAASGPLLAWLYNEPRVFMVMAILSITTFLGGLGAVSESIIRRQMRFGVLTAIEISALVGGSLTGLLLAWNGFGLYALVWMQVVSAAIVATGMCLSSGWRPGWPTLRSSLKDRKANQKITQLGGQVTLSSLLSYACRRIDNVLLGITYGAGALGLYAKAYNMLLLPIQQINGPVCAAATPTLCRLKDRPDDFRRAYLAGIAMTAGLGMLPVAWMWAAAEPLIAVLFGPQWNDAVPLFEALALAALAGTFNTADTWLMIPHGRGAKQLRLTFVTTVIIATGYIVALPWGVRAVALSFSFTAIITKLGAVAWASHGTSVSFRAVLSNLAPPTLAALIAASATRLLLVYGSPHVDVPPFVSAFIAGLFCSAVYLTTLVAQPAGRRIIRDV